MLPRFPELTVGATHFRPSGPGPPRGQPERWQSHNMEIPLAAWRRCRPQFGMANAKWNLRRLFQFSLLTVIVCLTVACVALGIVARRVDRQRNAVAAILKAGGRVSYEHSIALGSSIHYESATPTWFRRQLGEDWFSKVEGVTLYGGGCNDRTLQDVKELPSLRRIAL